MSDYEKIRKQGECIDESGFKAASSAAKTEYDDTGKQETSGKYDEAVFNPAGTTYHYQTGESGRDNMKKRSFQRKSTLSHSRYTEKDRGQTTCVYDEILVGHASWTHTRAIAEQHIRGGSDSQSNIKSESGLLILSLPILAYLFWRKCLAAFRAVSGGESGEVVTTLRAFEWFGDWSGVSHWACSELYGLGFWQRESAGGCDD